MARVGLTRKQAESAEILSNIVFKGLALVVLLGLLTAGFGVFIYLAVTDRPGTAAIVGGVDTLIGVLLKYVYSDLFGGLRSYDGPPLT